MALTGEAKKRYQREYMRMRQGTKKPRLGLITGSNKAAGSNNRRSNNSNILDPETKQKKLTYLRQLIAGQGAPRLNSSPVKGQSNARLPACQALAGRPLYNHLVHKAGDKVLMNVGGALKEVIVPELDQDGQEIESAAPVVFGGVLPEPVCRPVDMSQPVTMLEKPEKKKRSKHAIQ